MKLWYQSLSRQVNTIDYGTDLKKAIDSVIEPGTTVRVEGLSEAAGIGANFGFLENNDSREVIYNSIKAEKEGYDAFLIGNITDAGMRASREMVNIPVLGLSETTMHMAAIMGVNFGLVAISERWIPRLMENVDRYCLRQRFAGVEPMTTSPQELKKAFRDKTRRKDTIAEFTAVAEKLLAKGAEVIIPAGGEIGVLLIEDGIYEIGRAPIVTGVFELIKMGEMAVKLRARTGRFTSKRFSYAPPTGDFLQRIRDFYGADLYPDPRTPNS